MPVLSRNRLIQAVERMEKLGGFAGRIGQAALLADEDNLEALVNAFPHLFIEGQALEKPRWTPRLYISKMGMTENSK